jgi:ABC-type Fe3+/spermidine/putrescine transport system ATPase subunit
MDEYFWFALKSVPHVGNVTFRRLLDHFRNLIQPFASGDEALLMVRPEDLELDAREPSSEDIGLPVTCTDLVFQGPVVRCALLDPANHELIIYLEENEQKPEVRPGAKLWLRWRPQSSRLLREDENA